MRRVALALAVVCAGCHAQARGPGLPSRADAPLDLADDQDVAELRLAYDALPPGPARDDERRRLADEYARRADDELARADPTALRASLDQLCTLWQPAELGQAGALRPYAALFGRARTLFARRGDDVGTALVLFALMLADPAQAAASQAELDQLFDFADDAAKAENGDGAERARPIEILAEVANSLPSPAVIDRLVQLYRERQAAVAHLFRAGAADYALIRAHGASVTRTAWHIVRVLARADRLAEAPAAIAGVTGLGDLPDLRRQLAAALAPGARPAAFVALAALYQGDDDKGDGVAALRIAQAGLRRWATDPGLLVAAAAAAADLGQVAVAIGLYERGLAIAREHGAAPARDRMALAALYALRLSALVSGDRPHAAHAMLERLEALVREAPAAPFRPDLAEAWAAMGKGLIDLGELDEAAAYLARSIAARPTFDALEADATVALKRGALARAEHEVGLALALPAETPEDQVERAELLRLAGEIEQAARHAEGARTRFVTALVLWNRLTKAIELPAPLQAQSMLERGKLLWYVGRRETALAAFDAALAGDPDGSATPDAIAFLVVHGEHEAAVDALHAALVNPAVADYFKVYASLWVMADAIRAGQPIDAQARGFLAGRAGRAWYDDLARLATGKTSAAALGRRATSRSRRAELWFYRAALLEYPHDPARALALLAQVVGSGMVMFFEFDMATRWLAR